MLAFICNVSFADKIVTFDATTDKSDNNSITKDGVTFTISDGVLGNGTEYRIYKSNPLAELI